jgi:protein dithiol oxidoreductase (disulfide-forming)
VKAFPRSWLPLMALACLMAGGAAAAATANVTEGKDYVRSKAPSRLTSGDKIEVLEFFSYGGMHSQELEPYLSAWLDNVPADVKFRRVPVLFATHWLELAKICYTLEALGMERRLSREVFAAIEKGNLPLVREQPFLDWAEHQGLDRGRVAELYDSPQIAARINEAKVLAQAYDVQVAPTVIVDNKFATDYEHAGPPARFSAVVDALVAKARAERRQAALPSHGKSPPTR